MKLQLKYKNLVIGELSYIDNFYQFNYSEEFKLQTTSKNGLIPLTEFSDINKTYRSKYLFPAFECRLPSQKQPKIQKIITEEKLDFNNKIEMLLRFGKTCITNSFKLSEKK